MREELFEHKADPFSFQAESLVIASWFFNQEDVVCGFSDISLRFSNVIILSTMMRGILVLTFFFVCL